MNEEEEKRFEESKKKYEEWKNELKALEENAIIEAYTWGAADYGFSYRGSLVTNNKEIYEYLVQPNYSFYDNEEHESYIRKIKDLNDDEYKMVTDFIENEILAKEYKNEMLFDAGEIVKVNYNGEEKEVENNMEIYNKVNSFLEKIK